MKAKKDTADGIKIDVVKRNYMRDINYRKDVNSLIATAERMADEHVKQTGVATKTMKSVDGKTNYIFCFWSQAFHRAMKKLKMESGLIPVY